MRVWVRMSGWTGLLAACWGTRRVWEAAVAADDRDGGTPRGLRLTFSTVAPADTTYLVLTSQRLIHEA